MTEEKQGAAEWLRKWARIFGSADAYSCKKFMADEFGVSCSRMRCTDCNAVIFERIADRIESERRLSEGVEWPRFEDGELVKIGDEVEFEGEAAKVRDVAFNAEMFSLGVATATTSGRVYGAFGEPVKRPTPKVLGADGVEIKVGDTVYYDGDPEPLTVDSFDDPGCVYLTSAKGSDGTLYTIEPSLLTHKRPDSWEKLEEDAMGRACELAGSGHLRCIDCRWGEEGIGCQAMARLEILKRAKKLAGIEEEEQR